MNSQSSPNHAPQDTTYDPAKVYDLLVIGAGPTGIAVGCEALQKGLSVLVLDKGALTNSFVNYPTFLRFFTTRDRMEIAGIPLSISDDKANRQQALTYYRAVAQRFKLPLALHEAMVCAEQGDGGAFVVKTLHRGENRVRRARAICIATGYFDHCKKLGVPGDESDWVQYRYKEAYPHYGEHVLVIGGGNSSCKIALELWRNGAQVTMAVRDQYFIDGIKYWILPDLENRIKEGSIAAHFNTTVKAFQEGPRGAQLQHGDGATSLLRCDHCYVQIGYRPDVELLRRCGVEVDDATLEPRFDPDSFETNVPGVYVAGTVQAGLDTGRLFIDNSRDHCVKIIAHLKGRM